jgi:hypothetical protein
MRGGDGRGGGGTAQFEASERERVSDDPLCASRDARWAQWHEDAELRDEIQKDVVRTLPELAFFLEGTGPDGDNAGPLRYEAMKRVLFVYAKLNPGVRYVQGMNEVLGTVYFTLARDGDDAWAAHAEADAFFCFTSLMAELRDVYIENLDNSDVGIQGTLKRLGGMLAAHDPQLHEHLDRLRPPLDTHFYALRWITTLLSREFDLPDTVRLWDALFAERPGRRVPFVCYFCCTMLLAQRAPLLDGDFAACLSLLQNYPPSDDPRRLLAQAHALRFYDEQGDRDSAASLGAADALGKAWGAGLSSMRRWIAAQQGKGGGSPRDDDAQSDDAFEMSDDAPRASELRAMTPSPPAAGGGDDGGGASGGGFF